MAKINTSNYQPLSVWDGDDDLFIVQQVDDTKVATPNQIRDFVLAGGAVLINKQYAECSTARNVAAKTVTLPGFKLEAGARISVRFTDTGASNPSSGNITLDVNGTGAKEIVDGHTNMTKFTYTSGLFYNNQVNDYIYDGTYWVYLNRDNNTTYSSKTAASGGTATSLCTTGEKYTWNNKQSALTFDNVPTQNSNNPVKSGGIYSTIGDLTATGVTGASVAAQLGVLGNILSFAHFVQIPFTTGVLESIKAAFNNNIIPIDLMGITFGIVTGDAGSQRVVVVAQNQRLSSNSTRFAAIYFGAYTAPRFLQKQDGTDWTDVAL